MKKTVEKIAELEAKKLGLQMEGKIDEAFQVKKAIDFAKDYFNDLNIQYKNLEGKTNGKNTK